VHCRHTLVCFCCFCCMQNLAGSCMTSEFWFSVRQVAIVTFSHVKWMATTVTWPSCGMSFKWHANRQTDRHMKLAQTLQVPAVELNCVFYGDWKANDDVPARQTQTLLANHATSTLLTANHLEFCMWLLHWSWWDIRVISCLTTFGVKHPQSQWVMAQSTCWWGHITRHTKHILTCPLHLLHFLYFATIHCHCSSIRPFQWPNFLANQSTNTPKIERKAGLVSTSNVWSKEGQFSPNWSSPFSASAVSFWRDAHPGVFWQQFKPAALLPLFAVEGPNALTWCDMADRLHFGLHFGGCVWSCGALR